MIYKLKSKILDSSDSYNFYKNHYFELKTINKQQEEKIESLENKIEIMEKNAAYNSLKKLVNSNYLLLHFFDLFKESVNETNMLEDKKCPICGEKSLLFLPVNKRKNALCYNCGSFERQRLIFLYLKRYSALFEDNVSFLHFAPEECLYNFIREYENIQYITADIEENPRVLNVMDMCSIGYPDNSFNYIMANHVLEHIPDDIKAMSELYRTIKPYSDNKSKVILTVPIFTKYETTLQKEEYNTDELRTKYYGQKDHVRAYGMDFQDRLEQVGFKVKRYEISDICSEEEIETYGLLRSDWIFECRKM